MFLRIAIIIILSIFSCRKELNINDFANDFDFYQPELRIEALMLPTDNTAIVRIDRSSKLNEDTYYNCLDDNNDWNYYYCNGESFESLDDCSLNCNVDECIVHLYRCSVDGSSELVTYLDKESCLDSCEGDCVTDDVGIDGVAAIDSNNDGDYDDLGFGGDVAPDEGENDGLPSCNEPYVDDFNELLPNIHIRDCIVYMINGLDTCDFIFDESADTFFVDQNPPASIFDAEVINYGAWVPDLNCNEQNFFNRYGSEYKFSCDCSEIPEFSNFGRITAIDTLQYPVVFYNNNDLLNLQNCTDFNDEDMIFDCLEQYNIDTLTFVELTNNFAICSITGEIFQNNEDCSSSCGNSECFCFNDNLDAIEIELLANELEISEDELLSPKIYYATLVDNDRYQAVQYIYNNIDSRWIYYHGHSDVVTNSDFVINDKIVTWFESVVAEQYRNGCIVESSKYKYEIFTFSKNYKNYYFNSSLDLRDPLRTNLRDQNNNTIMGTFGAMAKKSIYFDVVTPNSILDQ